MQSTATIVVALLCGIPGCVAAAYALQLVVLSIAAGFYRQERPGRAPLSRLTVLVPAHDEALLIARCVHSLREQTYPADLYQVVVIADNCSDATALLARAAGADTVMIRNVPELRSKGHALRWAMDRILSSATAPDAVVIVDADSVADTDFLMRLVEPFEAGARAVQCDDVLESDGRGQAALSEAAFLLANRVRSAGRAVLGMSAHLFGNGMLFSSELLRAKPWNAYSSAEDLEYSLDLRASGERIAFAGAAELRSPAAPTAEASATQQVRWLGGQAHMIRTRAPRLVREAVTKRRPSLALVAFELCSPPLGFLAAGAVGGCLVVAGLVLADVAAVWDLAPWLFAVIAIPLYVLIGLRTGRAPSSAYRALMRAPMFILSRPLHARRLLSFAGDTWVRTERRPDGVPR